MAIICWGNLAKSADDTQRIEQAIQGYVEDHNENVNAHQIEGSSLYMHRVNSELDHLAESVKNFHIGYSFRAYKAVVDVGGKGDYTNIQDAIDYVNGLGGGKILILPGSYVQSDDLVMYSGIDLEGLDETTTIIDFDGLAKGMQLVGVFGGPIRNCYLFGFTIEGSKAATAGAITLKYCDDIFIENIYFESNRQVSPAQGYDIYVENSHGIKVRDCHNGEANANYYLKDSHEIFIEDILFENTGNKGIILDNVYDLHIGNLKIHQMTGNFISTLNSVSGLHLYKLIFKDCNHDKIYLNAVTDCLIEGVLMESVANPNEPGIEINTSERVSVLNCNIKDHVDGILFVSNIYCTANNNICNSNSRYGINISDADCDKCIVVGNNLRDNTSGGLNDLGTNTEKGHNVI